MDLRAVPTWCTLDVAPPSPDENSLEVRIFRLLNSGAANPVHDFIMPIVTDFRRSRIVLILVWAVLVLFGGNRGRWAALTLIPFAFMLNNVFRSNPEFDHDFFSVPDAFEEVVGITGGSISGDDSPVEVTDEEGRTTTVARGEAVRHHLGQAARGPRMAWKVLRPYMVNTFIVTVLTALGVRQHFECLFGIRDTGYVCKPHPSAYRTVLDALNISAEFSIMLDDSIANLHAAGALGMVTVLVGPDHDEDGADFVIGRVEEATNVACLLA